MNNIPQLQVALDITSLKEALNIARRAISGGVDIIEAGTPLIKASGVSAVRKLREEFPTYPIVADLKIFDAGKLEADLFLSAGADIVTVLAVAAYETIEEVIETVHQRGKKVMVDMMNVGDVMNVVQPIVRRGADIICLHVGVDTQRRRGVDARVLVEELKAIKERFSVNVAVAGGINEHTAPLFACAGADIIIVGGRITKAKDPEEAARRIKEAIISALKE
ncbi:MAG: orotidine 5-phosphate decarboxylase [Thermoprotei archaeon]|nr:MAG: orotidine 5-phosphate decarboxylase [Thermoprotei archaeon]